LLIATYRSDATALAELLPAEDEIGGLRRHIELALLSDSDCRALAAAVLGAEERLAPVRELLVRQAEGNPFYLEEILRALRDQGALEYNAEAGVWRLASKEVQAVLPPSLQGLLLDRIDRLPEGSKRLLQIAAVAGRQFPPALLGEVAGSRTFSPEQIEELIRGGFFERSQSTGRYASSTR
jgi:predicted ATPase